MKRTKTGIYKRKNGENNCFHQTSNIYEDRK